MADGLTSGQRAVNGERVRAFGEALGRGRHGLTSIRAGICTLVRERAWQEFVIPQTGEVVRYEDDQFEDFVKDPPFRGLNTTVETIAAFCTGDKQATAALARATGSVALPTNGAIGRGRNSFDTVKASGRGGNDRIYTLRRLKRDRPDLFALVLDGTLSANAAAIEAGFRQRATPLNELTRAWRKASAEERAAFLAEVAPQ
jgi:hypothetical protein